VSNRLKVRIISFLSRSRAYSLYRLIRLSKAIYVGTDSFASPPKDVAYTISTLNTWYTHSPQLVKVPMHDTGRVWNSKVFYPLVAFLMTSHILMTSQICDVMQSAILDCSARRIVVHEHSTGLQPCTERTSSLRIIHITKFAQIIFWPGKFCCPIALALAWHVI